ncbi:MAG: helix-turn-helix domain-containing protein [Pseudonocardiaceae bacterium]
MDGGTIGSRICELRRGVYTQTELAAEAGVSVDVIRKLEQGRRQTASIPTLHSIARVLGVDIGELLGRSRPVPSGGEDQEQVLAIRDALTSVDDLLGELDDADAPDITELSRSLTYAWGAFWAGRYGLLAPILPRLLAEAQAATHNATTGGGALAADLAAQVYQLTAGTLPDLGEANLAHTAAREALRCAAGAADPLREAVMHDMLGYVLIRQGRFLDAERVTVAAAEALQPRGEASTAQLSVYGGLLLRGATAASRQGRAGAATDLLREATATAEHTGADRTDYEVGFGPGIVVMQSTDVAMVTEDYAGAAVIARRMPRDAALTVKHRSRHLADVAHAQVRLRRYQAAESVLLTMERGAPDWTAHHRLPRLLVSELLTRGRPSTRLQDLAQRLHATPGRARHSQ